MSAETEIAGLHAQLGMRLVAVRRVVECAVVRPEVDLSAAALAERVAALVRYFEPQPSEVDADDLGALERARLEVDGSLGDLRRRSAELHAALSESSPPDWRRGWELTQEIALELAAAEGRWAAPTTGGEKIRDKYVGSIREWSFDALLEARRTAEPPVGRSMLTGVGPPLDVLVIDDEPDIRLLTAINLIMDGHRPWTAEDGREGYMTAAEMRPDVIVLDVMMPKMDGWEACERMRADRRTADIPIVFCTARSDPLDVLRGHYVGGDAYVTKPFSARELLGIVTEAAERDRRNPTPHRNFYPWMATYCVDEGVEEVRRRAEESLAASQDAYPALERMYWDTEHMVDRARELMTTASFRRARSGERQGEQMSGQGTAVAAGDSTMRSSVIRPLEWCGFAVVECEDGPSAYEAAKAHPRAVVIADLDLEVMDGVELSHWLSARAQTYSVILLGHAPWEPRRILKAYEAGASAVMLPPYNADHIAAVIRHVTGLPDADLAKAERFLPSQQIPSLTLEVAAELLAEAKAKHRRARANAKRAERSAERAVEAADRLERLVTELRDSERLPPRGH